MAHRFEGAVCADSDKTLHENDIVIPMEAHSERKRYTDRMKEREHERKGK